MLTDEQLKLFKKYCQQGGRLLIYGEFGTSCKDGTARVHPESVFGFTADLSDFHAIPAGKFSWQNACIELPELNESRTLSNLAGEAEIIAQGEDRSIYGVSAMNGNLIWLAGGVRSRHPEAQHYAFVLSRWRDGQTVKCTAPAYAADYIYNVPGAVLQALMPQQPLLSINSCNYQISHSYLPESGQYRIQLVNVEGLLAKPPQEISHGDIFQNFVPDAVKNSSELRIQFRCGNLPEKLQKVYAWSPELANEVDLEACRQNNALEIVIPPDTFAGFLEIEF